MCRPACSLLVASICMRVYGVGLPWEIHTSSPSRHGLHGAAIKLFAAGPQQAIKLPALRELRQMLVSTACIKPMFTAYSSFHRTLGTYDICPPFSTQHPNIHPTYTHSRVVETGFTLS